MPNDRPHYSVDTNIFINTWTRDYPPDVVPGLWEYFADLVAEGRIHASREVLLEIERKDDDVYAWCKTQARLWIPLDAATVAQAQIILAAFPNFVKTGTGRNHADPFVIALAKVNGYTVVTWEKGGSLSKPRIPFICEQIGVPCTNLIGLAKAERWVLTRK